MPDGHDHDLGFVHFGWRDYDTFTSRWTAPDPMGDAGGDPDWYGYCLDDPVNGVDPLGLWKDEHGNEIPKGRTVVEVFPDILLSPFMAGYTKKKVQNGLRNQKNNYTDENDWEARYNIEKEARDFGMLDGALSTFRFDTDDDTIQHYHTKAKRKIGKR